MRSNIPVVVNFTFGTICTKYFELVHFFFKPVYLSTIQNWKISLYFPVSYSPILKESLPIYSIPQLPYPFPPNPH